MRIKVAGNKRDSIIHVVKNADTVSIPKGTPLCLKLSATAADDDGLSVVLPATALAAGSTAFPYGVVTHQAIGVNQVSEAVVFGYCAYALVTTLTRSASSAVWPSTASLAAGAILQLDTLNNAFAITAASQAASNFLPFAVMLDSLASQTTQASTSSGAGTVTASITGQRVFVRML